MVSIERRNPPGLHATPGYHHVTSVEASRLVVANTLLVLEDAGTTPEDVVRTVIYVASGERRAFSTASTLLGVACLGFPGQLVELDVTAALA